MDWLIVLLDEFRAEALEAVLNPPADQKTEFGFGRINGTLFAVETIRARVLAEMEAQALAAERREAEF